MIAVSLDLDWAQDEVIADTLEILERAGVRATVFVTHASPLISRLDGHERAIHPDFTRTSDIEKELERLLTIVPEAEGARSHSYVQSTSILQAFAERGLVYDSNLLMFEQALARPFVDWTGLVRLPVYWEDDVNCLRGGTWDPAVHDLTGDDALFVFDFHPVHVYLNTESMERYERARAARWDLSRMKSLRNPEESGTGARVFLKRLLRLADEESVSSCTLGAAARRVLEASAKTSGTFDAPTGDGEA